MKADWTNPEFVEWYNRELEFADSEILRYIERLNPGPDDVLVDFGCGNGVLLEKVSPVVTKALGIDEAPEQLERAAEKLEGCNNVLLQQKSFLECDLEGWKFTRGSARKALHHLRDDEKFIFFKKIAPYFEKGALFLIEDAVFSFRKEDLEKNREMLLEEARGFYGPRWEEIEESFKETIFEEFSTDVFTWEKAMADAGFKMIEKEQKACFYGILLARKE